MRFKVVDRAAHAPWQGTLALASDGTEAAALPPGGVAMPSWLLLNLSGSVAARLSGNPALAGVAAPPGAGTQPVLLTDAQLDQVAGLIGLRSGAPIDLYATPAVFEDLTTTMPVLPELQRHCGVHWHMVAVAGDQRAADFTVRGHEALEFTAWDTGAAPPGCVGDPPAPPPGHSIAVGVRERASGRRAVFVRGLGGMALELLGALHGVDCLLVDAGAIAAPGLVEWLAALPVPRKVLLGAEAAAGVAGIETVADGQEIVV